MGLRMQPRSAQFFTLISKAGPNVVESAASVTEFDAALHERWAQLLRSDFVHCVRRTEDLAQCPLALRTLQDQGVAGMNLTTDI